MSTEVMLLLRQFVAGEPAIRRRIEQSASVVFIQDGTLVFSLPGLWELLFGELDRIPYPMFRAAIYRSTLNTDLAAMGLVVEVHRSSGKVDDSLYQLCSLDSD